jgi:hypothetical protein
VQKTAQKAKAIQKIPSTTSPPTQIHLLKNVLPFPKSKLTRKKKAQENPQITSFSL